MSRAFIIFTGHNDRAVVALCRAMSAAGVPFHLIANAATDPIFRTAWAPFVRQTRSDSRVDLALFEKIRDEIEKSVELVYCPTTEFINGFVLSNRERLEEIGFSILMPPQETYWRISNKSQSVRLIQDLCELTAPPEISWPDAAAPCVFKPRCNLSNGTVNYPVLCFNETDVAQAKNRLDQSKWYVQKYVDGQSYYLCGYLSATGDWRAYWQLNLLQQSGGKSIVLARNCPSPGLDAADVFDGLRKTGHYGPVMMEIIQDERGTLHYIEINPRFWGPLQLAVDACPELFALYFSDAGFHESKTPAALPAVDGWHWYAWLNGAKNSLCRRYPAATLMDERKIDEFLNKHDVYAREDTCKLHGVF